MSYIPEPAFEPSQEWVTRELYRISDTIDRILAGHRNVRVLTTCDDYTVNQDDNVIIFDPPGLGCGETITLNLPSVVDPRMLFIKTMTSTPNIFIDTPGSETIDGASSLTLSTQYEVAVLVSDGSNWNNLCCSGV